MTVTELLDRMPSSEITEWQVFFEMQEEYAERERRRAERQSAGPKTKPSIGDAASRADAITEARRAQGLE